jgi:hypothetical protein
MSMHQTVPLERYKCEQDSKLWSKNKAVVDDRQCDDGHCTEQRSLFAQIEEHQSSRVYSEL